LNHIFVSFHPYFQTAGWSLSIVLVNPMARTKQPTPLRRETSSEYFSKDQNNTELPALLSKEKRSNDDAVTQQREQSVLAKAPASKVDNTIVQLIIAVAGIYGSLCVLPLTSLSLHTLFLPSIVTNFSIPTPA
jgi:hypothetical protein